MSFATCRGTVSAAVIGFFILDLILLAIATITLIYIPILPAIKLIGMNTASRVDSSAQL
jgi:hypothetical protein